MNELRGVVSACGDRLPLRFAKARTLGLLETTVGAARYELLDVAWPGWRYLAEGEDVRDVVNPSLDALEILEHERAFTKKNRRWTNEPIALRWLVPAKRPVLANAFLGRTIVFEFPVDDGGPR
jgi:hypothetical protein